MSRPYTATALVLMVLVTVTKAEDSQEYELELCRNRGADWRHNQHNYIFSGFLKKVCIIRTGGKFSLLNSLRKEDWTGKALENFAERGAWTWSQ